MAETARATWAAILLVGPVNLTAALVMLFIWWGAKRLPRASHTTKPMGIYWLSRQRVERNPFCRWVIAPLEPYVRAARVLRAAGETAAANRVELERLRNRRRALSWRLHFMGKAFFGLVDALALFGYGLGRTAGWIAAVVLVAAGVFQVADNLGYMQYNTDTGGQPRFVSVVYATDLVVPVVGLAHESEWRPSLPSSSQCGEGAVGSCEALYSKPGCVPPLSEACAGVRGTEWVVKLFVLAEWAFRGVGLILCSIIAAALTTRAEAMFSRVED